MSSSTFADRAERTVQVGRIISIIVCRLSRELDRMKEILGQVAGSEMIDLIRAETSSHLQTIRGLMKDGQILPRSNLRLSQKAPHLSPCDRPLRIGVFPTAADPFHWLHLLSGLKAMMLFKLDKVIYVISGSDSRKPDLLRADIRHRMAQHVLGLFSPLFAYSPAALELPVSSHSSSNPDLAPVLAMPLPPRSGGYFISTIYAVIRWSL